MTCVNNQVQLSIGHAYAILLKVKVDEAVDEIRKLLMRKSEQNIPKHQANSLAMGTLRNADVFLIEKCGWTTELVSKKK